VVDAGVEAGIRDDVVHERRRAVAQHGAGDARARREPHFGDRVGDVGILIRDVREVELIARLVEQEDRSPLGVEGLAALLDDQRGELFEVEPGREGAAQVVEQLGPRTVHRAGV
jgi:hypothetical protein